ncbi:MAG: hypothetical protein SGJ11_14020 [Phycisphaerae bacterium]|nr:hypothetical protein [Phycisphaerae bacterium]
MPTDPAAIAGWIPAVVFPLATALQLIAIVRRKSAEGVSLTSWSLFAFANLCMYVYVGKYAEPQAILSGLGTASLNIAIVIVALKYPREKSPPAPGAS